MLEQRQPQGVAKYIGKSVTTSDGQNLGTLAKFLPNRVTEVPEWLVVEAGLIRSHSIVVPLAGSSFEDDHVQVAYESQVIADSPEVEFDEWLSPEAESILLTYFGLNSG